MDESSMFNVSGLLDSLTGTAQQRIGALNTQADAMAYDTNALNGLLTQNVEATKQAIGVQTQLAGEKAAIESQNAQLHERAQQIVGLDPTLLENDFTKAVATYTSAEQARKAARAEYDKVASVQMLDNPIEWLFGQLKLPGLAEANNSAVATRDAATEDIKARTTMLQQHKNTVIAHTADRARQYNMDLAQASASEAFIKLREEEAKNLSALASRRFNEFQLRDKAYDVQGDVYNKMLSLEELAARREDRRLTRLDYSEARQAKLQDKAEQEAVEAELNLNLQRFTQLVGMPNVTVQTIKFLPKEQQEVFKQIATSGTLGADMEDVLGTLYKVPTAIPTLRQTNPLVAQTVEKIASTLYNYEQAIGSKVNPATMKAPTAKEARKEAFLTYEDELVKSQGLHNYTKPLNHSAWDTSYNPYRAPHVLMNDLVSKSTTKLLAGNIVAETVKTLAPTLPQSQTEFHGADENRLLLAVAEQVKQRKLSPKDAAAQVVQYYSVATQINAAESQYGLFKLPPQKSYMVTLPAQQSRGKPIPANLLNQVSVEKMLMELNLQQSTAGPVNDIYGIVPGPEALRNSGGSVTQWLSGPAADFLRGYEKPAE